MMADTPLYCWCGNRLGLRRSDGQYVSVYKGRSLVFPFSNLAAITCEDCQRTIPVDKLATTK